MKCPNPVEGKEVCTRGGEIRHKRVKGWVKNGENHCISALIFHHQGGQRSLDS